jgi:hypothetical protein
MKRYNNFTFVATRELEQGQLLHLYNSLFKFHVVPTAAAVKNRHGGGCDNQAAAENIFADAYWVEEYGNQD